MVGGGRLPARPSADDDHLRVFVDRSRRGRSAVGRAVGGGPSAGCRRTTVPARAGTWQVRTQATPSTSATQLPQSPARQSVPPWPGCSPARRMASATVSPAAAVKARPSTVSAAP